METKSMGAFIAALRKSKGLTQKELAEMLFVSDKSVSRWERDEGSPDLSVLPALAEALGVTADELLRGEKKTEETVGAAASERREKRIANLAKMSVNMASMGLIPAFGAALLGIIAALICNNAFQRANLGFYIALIFFIGAIFVLGAVGFFSLSSISGEYTEEEVCRAAKRGILKRISIGFSVVLVLFASTLPLVTTVHNPYFGLAADLFAQIGAIWALCAAILCALVLAILRAVGIERGFYPISGEKAAAYPKKLRRFGRFSLSIALILTATYLASTLLSGALTPDVIGKKVVFEDTEAFLSYIQRSTVEDEESIQKSRSARKSEIEKDVLLDSTGEVVEPDEDLNQVFGLDGRILLSYYNPRSAWVRVRLNEQRNAVESIIVIEGADYRYATGVCHAVCLLPILCGAAGIALVGRRYLMY